MKITTITVSAGRKFNHPYEEYSNLSTYLSVTAELGAKESPDAAAKELQVKCEALVEEHKLEMLKSLEHLEEKRQEEFAGRHEEPPW